MNDELRIPPQSIPSEQAVLGGLMLSPESWPLVSDVLDESDFYRRDHQLIFRAIMEMASKGKPFDAVTLGEWFEVNGQSEMVDGGAYLIDLASNTPSAANIKAYADIVQDKSTLRKLIELGNEAQSAAFQPDGRDAGAIVSEIATKFGDLQPKQRGGFVTVKQAGRAWLEAMQRRFEQRERITGIPTPYNSFNHATRGLQPSTCYIIAARPSMGKSVVANSISACAAMRGLKVALFSLEAAAESVLDRCVANIGDVPYDWIQSPGTYPDDDDLMMSRATTAMARLLDGHLIIDDTPAITRRQFEAKARRQYHETGLDLIVVDHIHDFAVDPKLARFEYGAIVQTGKTLAKEWKIPVVMMAQLNRGLEGRTGSKRPRLADLRESGEIEQKADVITFLHREDYYEADTPMRGVLEMIIAKGRDIEIGTHYMRHRFDRMRIEDWEGPLPVGEKSSGYSFQGKSLGEF
jgi:replicative DNA helicase